MTIALVDGADPGAADFADGTDPEADVDAALHVALDERGIAHVRPRWDDVDVDWGAYDVAVVRTVYDYTTDRDRFVAWAAEAGTRTRVENPPDVLRWNTHKGYLLELEERGAPSSPPRGSVAGTRSTSPRCAPPGAGTRWCASRLSPQAPTGSCASVGDRRGTDARRTRWTRSSPPGT